MIKEFKILDKYITRQVIETFLVSLVIFTSIIFATDAFTNIVKQIVDFGIPLYIAAMLIVLELPSRLILAIPMGMLLSTLLTVNKMNNYLEITILKACGVGINRIAKPIFICAIVAALLGFTVNEIVAPTASKLAKDITIISIMQKNVPNGKKNFTYKELNKETGFLKRFFHVASVKDNKLYNITVLDSSKKNTIQVVYAKTGDTAKEGWRFYNGVIYTISLTGKILNTADFETFNIDNTKEAIEKITEVSEYELNFFALKKYLNQKNKELSQIPDIEKENDNVKEEIKKIRKLNISLYDKIALPFTCFIFSLMALPLAITGPRAKFNRGLLFSILIIFIFWILRAIALSLGQSDIIPPILAAWLPNIILGIWGFYMYRRKAYFIV